MKKKPRKPKASDVEAMLAMLILTLANKGVIDMFCVDCGVMKYTQLVAWAEKKRA